MGFLVRAYTDAMEGRPPQPELSRPPRRTWARRIVMPLLVLAVAAALLIWSRQRETAHEQEVLAAVAALCDEIARYPDHDPLTLQRVQQMNVSPGTVDQLGAVLEAGLAALTIDVRTGDADPPFGDGSATHQAFIRMDGRTEIVLRVHHPGDQQRVEVLGYWVSHR